MGKQFFKTFSLALAVGALLMPAVESVADEGQYHLVLGGQRLDFGSERQASNDSAYVIGFGYGISERWDAEISLAKLNISTRSGDDDVDQYRLDFFYTPDISFNNGNITPYVVTGIGHNHYNSDDETLASLGAGIKIAFTDNLDWRTGVRSQFAFDDDAWDFGIETALVFRFGNAAPRSRVAASPTPAPAQAAPTPAPAAPVVSDQDGDGVPDNRDDCPNTPRNHRVDDRGCSIIVEEVERIDLNVQFEFDRAEVRQQYLAEIRSVADFLRAHAGTVANLEGHTDSVGDAAYNQNLSERRVNAVKQVLVEQFGIEEGRVTTVGYGESRPAASNDTAEGRAQNRRVVSVISATVQVPQTR